MSWITFMVIALGVLGPVWGFFVCRHWSQIVTAPIVQIVRESVGVTLACAQHFIGIGHRRTRG